MHSQNMIVKNIYFKYFKTGSKVIGILRYSVITITLCYIVRYRITLYRSIAKFLYLNIIALST
jgi:hypothetical protein